MKRSVKHIIQGQPVLEGAGVHLYRVFGFHETELFDPFLLLDDFRSDTPEEYLQGFPWHPHRGIETITYVTTGDVEHGDSMGNAGVIGAGDVQWMTAGSGIVHQEMPKGDANGSMHGFQLWANLPAAQKMMPPRYRAITADDIPTADLGGGASAKVIAGEAGGLKGPMDEIVIDPLYLDVTLPGGADFSFPVARGRNCFLYATAGSGETAGQKLANRTMALFDDGDAVNVQAGADGLRFLLIAGTPLREPVAWRGPIVMNTQEELQLAFQEYRDGTFIKHTGPVEGTL